MAKKAKVAKGRFSNIFVQPEAIRAKLLSDAIDDYLYDTRNPKGEEEPEPIHRFRPSQLGKANCVRKMVYEYLGAEYETELSAHDGQLHRVFDNGHDVHDRLQGYLADMTKWSKGRISLIGRWVCKKCGDKYGFAPKGGKPEDHWCPRPDKCKCGSEKFHFGEVDVAIPAHLTWGQADGIVIIDGEKYVLEIKSANPNTFNSLNSKPPVYYLPQINLYMHGLGIFQTIFLFENKATQEIKEIRYRYDSKVLKPIFEKTSVAVKHIKAKKMPPRLKSPTEVKEHCRLCEYRQICGLTDDFKEKLRVRDYAK